MDVLKILIFGLFIVAFPLGEIARVTINEIALTLVDLAVALVVLVWLILKKRIPQTSISKALSIFIGTLALSLLVNFNRLTSYEFLVSSLYFIRWIFYALFYFIVFDLGFLKKSIRTLMLVGGLIIVLGGYIQYFLYPDLRNLYYLGWDEHLYRMFSSFLDPNFAGAFFVLYLLFLLDKLLTKPTLILKLLSILTLIAVVLTFSRSAYITTVSGLVCLLFLKCKKVIATGLVALFVIVVAIVVQLSSKSEGTNLLRIASGEARLDSMKNAITIFKDYPIFGVGFNSYRYAQRNYGFLDESKQSLRSGELKMIVHSGAGTDNSFLFILATSGIVGLAAFLYLLFKIIPIKNALLTSSIVALSVNSFFINSFFYPPLMLWMFTLIGILSSDGRLKGNK